MPSCAHVFAAMQTPRSDDRHLRVFETRDLAAALQVLAALEAEGFRMGEILLNHPPQGPQRDGAVPSAQVDLAAVRAGDLITTFTRPAASDPEWGDRKSLRRGHTDLEERILWFWRQHFDWLARSSMRLSEPMRELLPPALADRSAASFRMRQGAFYLERNSLDGRPRRRTRERRTAAFLARVPELWPGGPGYLGLFGMDGISTLGWATLLRHRHPELLRKRFVMAELCVSEIPERPTELSWMQGWTVEPVLAFGG